MSFISLTDFKNKVKDFARPNRFQVLINPPTVYNVDVNNWNLLMWIAETAQIPSRTQGEIPIKYHGMELKLPGDYSKENLTIGFLNSYGWEGKNFFDIWLEGSQQIASTNAKTKAGSMLMDSSITINQLGRTDKDILASYKFYDVFPANISAIELNQGESDSIEKFTVSFAYSYFESVGLRI